MADNGEQQPSGPPEYKVYRSRRGLLSRLRSPDLSGLRERKASGFTSLTLPNRDRAKRTPSLTIRTPEQP